MSSLRDDIKKILIDESVITHRIDNLSKQIEADFSGKDMMMIGILNGGCVFVADLLKRFSLPLTLEFLSVSSYRGEMVSGGTVSFRQMDMPSVAGKHILLVDDIFDTGRTMTVVAEKLLLAGAENVKTCAFARKAIRRDDVTDMDYVAFDIGDEFVVGYGLDYMGYYRNLPFVGELSLEAIERLKTKPLITNP